MISHRVDKTGSISVATEKNGALHRHVLHPGDDTSNETEEVQKLAKETWTQEVIDAWNELQEQSTTEEPDLPVTYNSDEFFLLFTKTEWKGIKQAAKEDDNIEYALDRLRTVRTINAESEETQNYLKYLVSLGLITREKAEAITSGSL